MKLATIPFFGYKLVKLYRDLHGLRMIPFITEQLEQTKTQRTRVESNLNENGKIVAGGRGPRKEGGSQLSTTEALRRDGGRNGEH